MAKSKLVFRVIRALSFHGYLELARKSEIFFSPTTLFTTYSPNIRNVNLIVFFAGLYYYCLSSVNFYTYCSQHRAHRCVQ